LGLYRQLQNKPYEADVLLGMAALERRSGELARAEALLRDAEQILAQDDDPMNKAVLLFERGRLDLAAGRDPRSCQDSLKELDARASVTGTSEIAQNVASLDRAAAALRAGEQSRLFRGELLAELPSGWRRWLERSGQL
jgi:hypothetical protein